MNASFAAEALLPEGWARDVRIEVDARGNFAAIQAQSTPQGAERLAGPVLPGMANVHSHAFQRAMAGLAEVRGGHDDDFWTWRELMYQFVARLTPEDAQAIARYLYIEMLMHGYTAVAEFHYVHNDANGKSYADPAEMLLRHLAGARDAGIAITLLPVLYAAANFGGKPLQPRQQRFASSPASVLTMVERARAAAGVSLDLRTGVAPHSLRAVDPVQMNELLAGLRGIDPAAPIHIHCAEQTKEVDDCVGWSGMRPVEWLLEHLPVDARWCVVHATQMTPEETRALAQSGATAGLCPSTEANLGDGIFPLLEYRRAGGRYGIGGDSHVSRDPAEELRLLEYIQRLATRRRNLVAGARTDAVGTTLWLEAAEGGAAPLGRAMGAIVPGRRADLVVLRADSADLAGRSGDAIANSLIFSGARGLVRDVMVGGKWLVRDTRHPLEQQSDAQFRRVTARLLA
ncbi:MAG TPA: formimidoylglutamate deiminase [Burkholderiales bacterium]|nr:formimidoylglutamate deiminase [Burkholderiales bacterium]